MSKIIWEEVQKLSPKSGDVLEYRITYTNTTTTVVTSFVINDNTPAYTTFQSAAEGTTAASLGSCIKVTPANPAPAVRQAGGTRAGRARQTRLN